MINVYGMKTESEMPDIYRDFIREEGAPNILRRDNSQVQSGTRTTKLNRKFIIGDQFTEPGHPQQNPAELRAVKYLKDHSQVLLDRTGAPEFCWLAACEYIADVHNICSDETINHQIPLEARHGGLQDISAFLEYKFYEEILYLDSDESFPSSKEKPGWWLGVAHNVGDIMTFKILTHDTEKIICRSVLRPARDDRFKNKRVRFEPDPEDPDISPSPEVALTYAPRRLKIDLGLSKRKKSKQVRRQTRRPGSVPTPNPDPDDTDPGEDDAILDEVEAEPGEIHHTEIETPDAEPQGDMDNTSTVDEPDSRRSHRPRRNPDRLNLHTQSSPGSIKSVLKGVLLGLTLLDTFQAFPVHDKPFKGPLPTLNENESFTRIGILSPREAQRLRELQDLDLLNESLHPDQDDQIWKCIAIVKHKARTIDPTDVHTKVKAVWTNGDESWIRLDALRLQDPYPLVKYGVKKKLTKHPEWSWVKDYLENDDHMASLVQAYKASVGGIQYMFGVEIPKSVKHALELDKANGNNLWRESIDKELEQINDFQTFRRLKKGEHLSAAYQRIPYFIVFANKFDGRRKARLVANGSRCEMDSAESYSGVVGMETVRLGFLLAEMNGLKICAADIGSAYLHGKTREKCYIVAGPEFGDLEGEKLVIDKGLYGLKSSGARFHEHLSDKIRKMGYRPSKADSDFWIKQCNDGHYEYIASYVDDVISFSRDPMKVIEEFKKDYPLKGVGEPEYYLGGNVDTLDDTWKEDNVSTGLSARTYIKNAVEKFELMFGAELRQQKSPMAETYHPETDDTPLLDTIGAAKFRALVGSANWAVTLGRFDVQYATQMMSRFNMAPREGHLEAMKRVFGYLKKFPKGKIVIDSSYRDNSKFISKDHDGWKEFYPDASEQMPDGMPVPFGKKVRITCYVDADHAHDTVTRRSVTAILLFVNNTPIRWYSKRQKTVETSTYGSELVAARIATDIIIEIRYILRMVGVPIDGPALLLGDNSSVVLNTSVPSSVLKKKHHACAYHRVREAIAGNIMRFVHIPGTTNYADVLSKPLSNEAFHNLVKPLLFRVPISGRREPE
jgi:hypothetical protein